MNSKRLILSFITLLSTMPCFARPPKVIKMVPENGAVDVKPGPAKIRILFDQDMNTGTMSICGGGENFPEIVGKPQWTGKRAFLMNVQLKPNHDYTFSINCPSAQNFKSVRGEPAEVLPVNFRTANPDNNPASNPTPELKEQNKQAVIALQEALANDYSYNDMKKVNWEALFQKYNDSLLNAPSPMEFAKIAGLMLANAKDKHMWLNVNGQGVPAYRNPVTPNVNIKLIPTLVPNFKKYNDTVWTGRFADGIGYIYINTWSKNRKQDFDKLYIALTEFSNAPGLIIDVRGNGGGSETIAQKFAECFIDKPAIYAKHVYIDSKSPGGFTSVQERILQPNKGRPRYRGHIAVLTGPVVMSSCEAFVLMMKQVPNCTIIGEPTQGSSGNPKPHDLGNGVTVYLPSWKAMLPDETYFEGKGIKPDIMVPWKQNKNQNDDPVIEAALKFLRNK